MCNAHNHPPGCTCKFAGGNHGQRRSGSTRGALQGRLAEVARESRIEVGPSRESCLVPNARCPVCGQAVFYYRNDNGSSVFFDDTGPSWPKHPCTSTLDRPLIRESVIPLSQRAKIRASREEKWAKSGWEHASLQSIKGITLIIPKLELMTRGKDGTVRNTVFLYVNAAHLPRGIKPEALLNKATIFFVQKKDNGYLVSAMSRGQLFQFTGYFEREDIPGIKRPQAPAPMPAKKAHEQSAPGKGTARQPTITYRRRFSR